MKRKIKEGKTDSILKWKSKMNSSAHGGEYLHSKTFCSEGEHFFWDSRDKFHVSKKTSSQKMNVWILFNLDKFGIAKDWHNFIRCLIFYLK